MGLPVVYWLVCGVVCGVVCHNDHKFIGAWTENLKELISPAALQQVAGERKYGSGLLPGRHTYIPNQTFSQPVVKITKRFRRRVLSALRDQDQ